MAARAFAVLRWSSTMVSALASLKKTPFASAAELAAFSRDLHDVATAEWTREPHPPSPSTPQPSAVTDDALSIRSRIGRRRFAFAAYLCKSRDSTFDRLDGEGSELGALAHGYSLQHLHRNSGIDSLLLHVVIPGKCADLSPRYAPAIHAAYTHVIRFNGSSRAEAKLLTLHHQAHLWLKLLVLNLTAYDKVMWLGLDTMPLHSFAADASWQCNASAVTQNRSSSMCIEYNGNADTMLLTPNPQRLEQIVDDVTSNRNKWDGIPGYDNKYLNTKIRMGVMSAGQLQHETPRWQQHPAAARYFNIRKGSTPQTWVFHWTGGTKPWYISHCRTLPGGATLSVGKAEGKVLVSSSCGAEVLPSAPVYWWWRALHDALCSNAPSAAGSRSAADAEGTHSPWRGMTAGRAGRPPLSASSCVGSASRAAADAVLAEWGVLETVTRFGEMNASSCTPWVDRFPLLRQWCTPPEDNAANIKPA